MLIQSNNIFWDVCLKLLLKLSLKGNPYVLEYSRELDEYKCGEQVSVFEKIVQVYISFISYIFVCASVALIGLFVTFYTLILLSWPINIVKLAIVFWHFYCVAKLSTQMVRNIDDTKWKNKDSTIFN